MMNPLLQSYKLQRELWPCCRHLRSEPATRRYLSIFFFIFFFSCLSLSIFPYFPSLGFFPSLSLPFSFSLSNKMRMSFKSHVLLMSCNVAILLTLVKCTVYNAVTDQKCFSKPSSQPSGFTVIILLSLLFFEPIGNRQQQCFLELVQDCIWLLFQDIMKHFGLLF